MSNKKNYNKISTDKVKEIASQVENAETDVVDEPVVKQVFGVVCNCEKLNIRKRPNINADVVTVVDKGTELEINEKGSSKEFYKVSSTEGFYGYCMKAYISINS